MEQAKMNKFWKVTNEGGEKRSRMDLFGYVGASKDWGGFNEKEFLEEFRKIPSDNALDISINSFGGSVFTALSIYNLLKTHKGEIIIRVDGTAMSAATIITSVPNAKVIMPKGAMMMIHKVSTFADGNADDFKKAAEDLEKIEQNVIDIYAQKTGKTAEEIKPYVDAETYFTAAEAVDFGLADEMDESAAVENVASGDVLNLNGLKVSAEMFGGAPDGFFKQKQADKVSAITNQAKEEEKPMTLEKLKAEHPEIVEAIRKEALNEGAQNERARVKAIEEIAVAGHEELVAKAKFEEPMTAEQLAVAILKADKAKNAAALAARTADGEIVAAAVPVAEGVIPVGGEAKTVTDDAEMKALMEAGRKAFNRK